MKVAELLSELRGLPVAELRQRAADLDEQVFRLRLQASMGQAAAGHKIRPIRRQVARIKTVLGEKDIKD
jgi:large subunit ribosomal protein L29